MAGSWGEEQGCEVMCPVLDVAGVTGVMLICRPGAMGQKKLGVRVKVVRERPRATTWWWPPGYFRVHMGWRLTHEVGWAHENVGRQVCMLGGPSRAAG